MPKPLVLASGSRHRRALLDRLGLDYQIRSPDIDESRRPGETPTDYVARLSIEKARAVATAYPDALIIGSDQASVLDGAVLGKPGGHDRARRQLLDSSGRRVEFLTGLTLLDSASGATQTAVVPFAVRFRQLEADEIERYLAREQPYDCAGSFKSEGLGVALFEAMEGEDPTALIGLPLIRLCEMLRAAGLQVP